MVKNLTTEEFKELVFDYTISDVWKFKGNKPAIIDYFALWCSPCQALSPVLDELSIEYPNIDFYKIDTDAENELAMTFAIKSIPSVLFIPLTGLPQMSIGVVPKETLKQAIKQVLGVE